VDLRDHLVKQQSFHTTKEQEILNIQMKIDECYYFYFNRQITLMTQYLEKIYKLSLNINYKKFKFIEKIKKLVFSNI